MTVRMRPTLASSSLLAMASDCSSWAMRALSLAHGASHPEASRAARGRLRSRARPSLPVIALSGTPEQCRYRQRHRWGPSPETRDPRADCGSRATRARPEVRLSSAYDARWRCPAGQLNQREMIGVCEVLGGVAAACDAPAVYIQLEERDRGVVDAMPQRALRRRESRVL
jgi:hypothetical protein